MKKILFYTLFVFVAIVIGSFQFVPKQHPNIKQTQFVGPILRTKIKETKNPIPTPIAISPAPTPPAKTAIYIVKPGDSLWTISQKFGVSAEILALTNKINDPKVIFPGQILLIEKIKKDPTPEPEPPNIDTKGKIIVVVLHAQRVYAYQDGVLLKTFIVSTGTIDHPTKTGRFRIQVKLISTTMTDNVTYNLPGVPWTMYFGNDWLSWHEGYSLHGTYWHNNFGMPMSHGCVNLRIEDAEWLYYWSDPTPQGGETDSTVANPGTVVLVQE